MRRIGLDKWDLKHNKDVCSQLDREKSVNQKKLGINSDPPDVEQSCDCKNGTSLTMMHHLALQHLQ